jgi:fumarylacetoacetase
MSVAAAPAAELDATHDPAIRSWVENANAHSDFPLQNLPFGVFSPRQGGRSGTDPRGGIRIGDWILDLRLLAGSDLLTGPALDGARSAAGSTLNEFFGLGAEPRRALRARVHSLMTEGSAARRTVQSMLHSVDDVVMHLPATVGDYTDFYVGINHAVTVGTLFRPDNPLLPNYKWVPIGYHGRASSIRVSGESFHRPRGQRKAPADTVPSFEPTRNLDFELELGIWVGQGNEAGEPIPTAKAARHVAGYCLLNDWSARDIQSWEYQPLGPFLSKNFATTVSAWVVTPEALAPYRSAAPIRQPGDPAPLPYLFDTSDQAAGGIDVDLEVLLCTAMMRAENIDPQALSLSSTRHMYWTVAQMIAHHTSGGCNLRPGDLLGTGTISTPDDTGYGSLLEMTGNGSRALQLPSGESRTFLQDGDEIFIRARAQRPGAAPIGFGECRAVVLPAVQ